ncbi:unnamed protein product [Acanthoscelides obtectus]|uniref:Uncharacterized protein n=1 Tax=Acanthoscelides obtectus TaxID=200917 RepID=A0A9P0KPH9_ACAOB|nr:unnamed protein product [Acanthoscelides obtectus]CAK1674819.1 hypothetical protein AOBTE_LOCUS29754 [Acanthoscelides obtectus]
MQQYEMLRIVIHKSKCYRISVGENSVFRFYLRVSKYIRYT